jgi:transcriptional regulator with XRE-family HTH domain
MADNQTEKIRGRVKDLFDKSGLTGEEFAKKCGITRQTLYNITKENSKFAISEKTIATIAAHLGIDFNSLMGTDTLVLNDFTKEPVKREKDLEDHINCLKLQVEDFRKMVSILEADKELLAEIIRKKLLDLPTKSKAS